MYFSPGEPRLTFNRIVFLLVAKHNIFPLLLYSSLILWQGKKKITLGGNLFLISTFLHCLSWVYFYLKGNLIGGGKRLLSPSGPLLFGSLFFPSVCFVITQLRFVLFVLCTERAGERKKKGKFGEAGLLPDRLLLT